ncbi:MAG: hypothetical protein ACLP5O_18485 [Acidimicrobiales bacterium]
MTGELNHANGWWVASDGNWYPPEQHPDYRPQQMPPAAPVVQAPPASPSIAGLPPLFPEMAPPLSLPGAPPESGHSNWKWIVAAGVVVGALLLVVGIVMSHGSPPKTSASSPPTSSTVNPIQVAASQFKQYENEYAASVQAPVAALTADDADIAKQADRISTDQTAYQNNEFGSGCNAGDYANYLSCVSQDQQTAAAAQADETAAIAAAKNDHSQAETADQQMENVISTFVQQLDSLVWPTSTSRQDAAQLAQSLTNLRTDYSQEATDQLNGLPLTQDNQAMATDGSDIQTEAINVSTVLGIPPPPAPATT